MSRASILNPLVARFKVNYNVRTMGEPPSLSERGTPPNEPSGDRAIDISGGDVRAGRDIVAGDVKIAGDSISGQSVVIQRGFSANDVTRLVLLVGGLVLATALIFFVAGAIVAAPLVATLNRPLAGGNSSPTAAAQMQQKIDALNSLQPGQEFRVGFTEDEVSSYFRFVLGPTLGVMEGKARFMDTPGQIMLGGNIAGFGGRPFMAQMKVTTGVIPFELESAWLKVLPTPQGVNFGWIPITPLAQSLGKSFNAQLFGKVRFTNIRQVGAAGAEVGARALMLDGVAQ